MESNVCNDMSSTVAEQQIRGNDERRGTKRDGDRNRNWMGKKKRANKKSWKNFHPVDLLR